jgi:hypothetical protein
VENGLRPPQETNMKTLPHASKIKVLKQKKESARLAAERREARRLAAQERRDHQVWLKAGCLKLAINRATQEILEVIERGYGNQVELRFTRRLEGEAIKKYLKKKGYRLGNVWKETVMNGETETRETGYYTLAVYWDGDEDE